MNIYLQITFATIFGGVAGAAISYITKLYFTEKIKGSIKSEYDNKLEVLKSELKKNEIAISSALNIQNQGLQIGQNETVESIKSFWGQYLILRKYLAPIAYIDWFVLESEFNELFTPKGNENVARDITNTTYERQDEMAQSSTSVEKLRPFLTTNLWIYFSFYHTFVGRILYLYGKGVKEKKVSHWKIDEPLLKMTKDILSDQEYNFVITSEISTIKAIQNFIEEKILVEVSKILTGHMAAENAYLQALRLIKMNEQAKN